MAKTGTCAYRASVLTIEYVFPESWYADEHRPSDMLTVPACSPCNGNYDRVEKKLFLPLLIRCLPVRSSNERLDRSKQAPRRTNATASIAKNGPNRSSDVRVSRVRKRTLRRHGLPWGVRSQSSSPRPTSVWKVHRPFLRGCYCALIYNEVGPFSPAARAPAEDREVP